MNVKLLLLLPFFIMNKAEWHNNLNDAEKIAQKEHKYVLLNFSGSDWCGPCMQMRKEFFESDDFRKMADTELVLVNADFPRNKKNQLSAAQQKLNDEMADKYNAEGKFPYTLLLNSEGRVLGSWDGLPKETVDDFIIEIHNVVYSENK